MLRIIPILLVKNINYIIFLINYELLYFSLIKKE